MKSYYTNQTLAGSLANALVYGLPYFSETLPANFDHVISLNRPQSCAVGWQGESTGRLAVVGISVTGLSSWRLMVTMIMIQTYTLVMKY